MTACVNIQILGQSVTYILKEYKIACAEVQAAFQPMIFVDTSGPAAAARYKPKPTLNCKRNLLRVTVYIFTQCLDQVLKSRLSLWNNAAI